MATQEQCRAALDRLATHLAQDAGQGARAGLDRTMSVQVSDLAVTFTGRLHDGSLDEITTEPAPKAQIRFVMTSDDLMALADGRLGFAQGWASGRLKVHASMLDLLKLRTMM
jgi:putative sterol carrier protein